MKTEIDSFFSGYANAFMSKNLPHLAEFYSLPATFFTEEAEEIVFDESSFCENTRKVLEAYEGLGICQMRFSNETHTPISKFLTLVSLQWQFLNAESQLVYCATTRYLLRNQVANDDNTENELKIAAVFMVDEMTQFLNCLSNQD